MSETPCVSIRSSILICVSSDSSSNETPPIAESTNFLSASTVWFMRQRHLADFLAAALLFKALGLSAVMGKVNNSRRTPSVFVFDFDFDFVMHASINKTPNHGNVYDALAV